jgi:hypothetical protein
MPCRANWWARRAGRPTEDRQDKASQIPSISIRWTLRCQMPVLWIFIAKGFYDFACQARQGNRVVCPSFFFFLLFFPSIVHSAGPVHGLLDSLRAAHIRESFGRRALEGKVPILSDATHARYHGGRDTCAAIAPKRSSMGCDEFRYDGLGAWSFLGWFFC